MFFFRPHQQSQPVCRNRSEVEANLRLFYPQVSIVRNGDHNRAEIGGELPAPFVSALKAVGAEVLRYCQRGVVSTVVNY